MTATTAPLTDAQLDHLNQIEVIPTDDHWGTDVITVICHYCQAALPTDNHHDREQHVRRATRRAA